MGQRISIQYSIDIDDLEDEVVRLLNKSFGELATLSDVEIVNPLSLNTMESVDSVRQRLAAIDATLQDVTAIVSGYVGFKASPATSQVEQDTEVEEDKNEAKHEVPAQAEYSF